jgi:3',5'-cyclic AMP phosphodiesterase CpdA
LPLSRRQFLRIAGLSLAVPATRAASPPTSFRFAIVSDIHCRDQRCHPWLRKLTSSIRSQLVDFCILNGDLADDGQPDQLTAVKSAFGALGVPIHATVGNHDYDSTNTHTAFDRVFPGCVNSWFEHKGWQFVVADSTDDNQVFWTNIQPRTFAWLDAMLPKLDRTRPTVLCTHFPLGSLVLCRPLNAGDLLDRFETFNLRATFSGHWHGYAERHFDHASVTNSRCASWWRTNHDGSPEKGYFLCDATAAGELRHQFCVVPV